MHCCNNIKARFIFQDEQGGAKPVVLNRHHLAHQGKYL